MALTQDKFGNWIDEHGNVAAYAGATPDDLRYLRNPDIGVQSDAHGSYTTSVSGDKNYLPDMSTRPNTTFTAGAPHWDPLSGSWDQGMNWGGLGGAVLGGTAVAAPLAIAPAVANMFGGAGAGAGGAIEGTTGAPTYFGTTSAALDQAAAGTPFLGDAPALTGAASAAGGAGDVVAGAGSAGAGKMGVLSSLGKMFSKGLDPTTLFLGALSLYGGKPYSIHEPYTGDMTSPENTLQRAATAALRQGQSISERAPVQLRAVAPPPVAPVNIPGIPFQIGGGFGHDPALDNPDLLTYNLSGNKYDPFQSVAKKVG